MQGGAQFEVGLNPRTAPATAADLHRLSTATNHSLSERSCEVTNTLQAMSGSTREGARPECSLAQKMQHLLPVWLNRLQVFLDAKRRLAAWFSPKLKQGLVY